MLTNLPTLEMALKAYARRFRIEEMFQDWKLGGYCLESTQVRGQRLLNLILMIAIAYTSVALKARHCNAQGVRPYLTRGITESHRTYPRHTHFYIGSCALIWANCWGRMQDTLLA
ncbi:hypothetical protein ACN4EG_21880 [Alkalinema pantanalense CENA528]|uniref:hypothetical protein n=1 Tax=Alkalinema pantanalense TaxID=1620705 RepID=UPI003D6DE4B1